MSVGELHVRDSLRRMWRKGDVHELRLLDCQHGNRRPFTVAGYFDDPDKAAAAIVEAEETYEPTGVYWTPNLCDPAVLARSPNQLREYPDVSTANHDIAQRRFLLLDFDPVRPSGVSATDAELALAKNKALEVRNFLSGRKWGQPFQMMTGNGYRLNYPISLANDDESTVRIEEVLRALDACFSDQLVKIDLAMSNAARLDKVPGTMARKGHCVADRPHRRSELEVWPRANRKQVSSKQMETLVGMPAAAGATVHAGDGKHDLDQLLEEAGVKFKKIVAKNRGSKYLLDECPFHPDHGGKDTVILVSQEGRVGFKCQHDRCRDFKWKDLKSKLGLDVKNGNFANYANLRMGVHSQDDPWDELIPFESSKTLDPFPVDCLPDVWRNWVSTTSSTFQVPPEMPALISMGVVSASVASNHTVAVDRSRGWVEPVAIWTAAIAEPGSLKSKVVTQAIRPLRSFVEEERKLWLRESNRVGKIDENEVRRHLSKTQSELRSTTDPSKRRRLHLRIAFLVAAINEDEGPKCPDYLHEDITLEALTEVRAEQGQAAVISSEAGIFNVMSGMYSNDGQANLDATLKGYDAEPFSRKRVGRPTVHGEGPLVLAITPQPVVLERLKSHQNIKGRGVLGRFMFARCEPLFGRRIAEPPKLKMNVIRKYNLRVRRLLERSSEPDQRLELGTAAFALHQDWFHEVDKMLGPGAPLSSILDWGGKLVGRTARIAALLHLLGRTRNKNISKDTYRRAVKIARWSIPHALSVYGIVAMDPIIHTALAIRDVIVRKAWCTFSERELFESVKGRSCFSSVDDLKEPVRILQEHRYIRRLVDANSKSRGRPSGPKYEVHPALR